MEQSPSGILTLDDPEAGLHLPPGQTPITSAKRIRRLRNQPATVGTVDDAVARLAHAMLVQYGPLASLTQELMARQMAVEDFCTGELDTEGLKARIAAISMTAQLRQNALRDQPQDQAKDQPKESPEVPDAP